VERAVTILIWVIVFCLVVGVVEVVLNALAPENLDRYTGPVAIVLGWWVAELVRKKRARPQPESDA